MENILRLLFNDPETLLSWKRLQRMDLGQTFACKWWLGNYLKAIFTDQDRKLI